MRTSFCRPQKRKGQVNCNYFLRKWGCRSEQARKWVRALHDSCKHKTPFGKDLPVWYWRTTKQQRKQDKYVSPCSYLSDSETQSLYPCTHSNDAVPASSWAMLGSDRPRANASHTRIHDLSFSVYVYFTVSLCAFSQEPAAASCSATN